MDFITEKDINVFNISNEHTKNKNDKNNKLREKIIWAIVNKKIPEHYYLIPEWLDIKNKSFDFIYKLNNNRDYINVECVCKGGRKFNYDFTFTIFYEDNTSEIFNIEFKFNLTTISGAPQFVSPMKPSQYMYHSFENEFYENYVEKLSTELELQKPDKEVYLKEIHSPDPECMKVYKEKYYKGSKRSSEFTNKEEDIKFYKLANKLSKESIKTFIENTELNIELLSQYLIKSQRNKIYMLYSKNGFTMETVDIDDYIIVRYIKSYNRFNCYNKKGKLIKVLLRWKNGNGIAFPAFQIS